LLWRLLPLLLLAACTTAPPRTFSLQVDPVLPPPRIETRNLDAYEYRAPDAVRGARQIFDALHGKRLDLPTQLEKALQAKAPPSVRLNPLSSAAPRIHARFVAAVLSGEVGENASLALVLRVRAHFFAKDGSDGTVLGEALYEGRKRRAADWLADDARLLRDEVGWGIEALAAELAAQLRAR
jgi:hypothetical protein